MEHPSTMFDTVEDADKVFGIVLGFVNMSWRIKFQDKHDCAMDIFLGIIQNKDGGLRKAKQVNKSFLNKRVSDRILDWTNKAYRRLESAKELKDHHDEMPITEMRDFLNEYDMSTLCEVIGMESINEYHELFTGTVKATADRLGLSTRAVDKRRKKLLESIEENILDNHPDLYRDVKNPGSLSKNLGK